MDNLKEVGLEGGERNVIEIGQRGCRSFAYAVDMSQLNGAA